MSDYSLVKTTPEYYLVETAVKNLKVGDYTQSPTTLKYTNQILSITNLGKNDFKFVFFKIICSQNPEIAIYVDGDIKVLVRHLT
ncbi:unnamed protein product [marine sediment metagenome]|uniref:Uncharacterized protein n=1 Tax=marine sediment metagenome TaxID=412755 RepID=X0RFF4_9ZZZZ